MSADEKPTISHTLSALLAEHAMLSQEMEYILKSLANRVTLVISAIGVFAAVTYSGKTSIPEELFLIGVPRLVFIFGILYLAGMYLLGVHALRRGQIERTVNELLEGPVMQWDSMVVPKTYYWKVNTQSQASALLAFVLVALWFGTSIVGVVTLVKDSNWAFLIGTVVWSIFELVSISFLLLSKSLNNKKAGAVVKGSASL